jgi:tetratricopeptide (TPR) repeat protein
MELSDNYEFNYRKLLKFLANSGHGGYVFAIADDFRLIPQINSSLVADLKQKGLSATILFLRTRSDEPLVHQIRQKAEEAQAIIIANLFDVVSDTSEGLNQLLQLNFSREELQEMNLPLLLWVDTPSLNVIANQAPDLFSQRSFTTIHFTGLIEEPLKEAREKPEWQKFISSEKFKETEARIETLQRRLTDAEKAGYPVQRIASEIAMPLAKEYAQLIFMNKAQALLEKYEPHINKEDHRALQELAQVYYSLHQYPQAIKTLQQANKLLEPIVLSGSFLEEWYENLVNISDWMQEFGLPGEALELLRQTEKELLKSKLISEAGKQINWLFILNDRLGDLNLKLGDLQQAKESYEKSAMLAQNLSNVNPNNEQISINLSICFNKLGDLEKETGNLQKAKEYFERSLALTKKLIKSNLQNEDLKRNESICYSRLSDIVWQLGDLKLAKEYAEKSLAQIQQLSQDNPHNELLKSDLAAAFYSLGISTFLNGEKDYLNHFKAAHGILKTLLASNPLSAEIKKNISLVESAIEKFQSRKPASGSESGMN